MSSINRTFGLLTSGADLWDEIAANEVGAAAHVDTVCLARDRSRST
jgi:hypothetical protein